MRGLMTYLISVEGGALCSGRVSSRVESLEEEVKFLQELARHLVLVEETRTELVS